MRSKGDKQILPHNHEGGSKTQMQHKDLLCIVELTKHNYAESCTCTSFMEIDHLQLLAKYCAFNNLGHQRHISKLTRHPLTRAP